MRKEVCKLLKQFDFVDDSKSAVITFCQNDDLKAVRDYIVKKEYNTPYDISDYAFYLHMKRNHPDRIIEDE